MTEYKWHQSSSSNIWTTQVNGFLVFVRNYPYDQGPHKGLFGWSINQGTTGVLLATGYPQKSVAAAKNQDIKYALESNGRIWPLDARSPTARAGQR